MDQDADDGWTSGHTDIPEPDGLSGRTDHVSEEMVEKDQSPSAQMSKPPQGPEREPLVKQAFADWATQWDDVRRGPAAYQSNELKFLAESITGARLAWDRTQEELTAMRELISRDQSVLALLDARLEIQRREIEAIEEAQAKLGEVVAGLPKTLRQELEGSEYLERIKSLTSLISAEGEKEKILMSTARAARSAFLKVQEELISIQGLMSARDQAVLGLLDAGLEKMHLQRLEERLEEIAKAQAEFGRAIAELPATIAQQIGSSEYWDRLRTLQAASSVDDSPAEALMEMLKGTMSAWVTMQEEMNEIRNLITARDQTIPSKEITARIRAIEKRQDMLSSALVELPATIRRDFEHAIFELPATLRRELDDVRHTDKIVAVLTSALSEKAQERTFLLNTVEGARSAFFKMQDAVTELRELQGTRDKSVVELVESRLNEIETRRIDARIQDAQMLQGTFEEAQSELAAILRREIEAAVGAITDRVGKEVGEIVELVSSLPKTILTELADAAEASVSPPSGPIEEPEEGLVGQARDTRFRLPDQFFDDDRPKFSLSATSGGVSRRGHVTRKPTTPSVPRLGATSRGVAKPERKSPVSRTTKASAVSPGPTKRRLSAEGGKGIRTESKRNPKT